MKRLVILDSSVRLLFHSMLVLALYFLFAGHNQPGGGFVGGLTASAAVSLRYVAGGVDAVRASFRFAPWTILGTGLAVSVITALVPVVLGGTVLEHDAWEADVTVLGSVKATSALPFDVGVFLVVLGLALMAFEAFGDDRVEDRRDLDTDGEAAAARDERAALDEWDSTAPSSEAPP